MRLRVTAYLAAAVLAAGLLPACRRGPRVLDAAEFAGLLEDMYVADQIIRDDKTLRDGADTSLFFDPIFSRHGCSFEDYDRSINYYVDHPDKYAGILENVYKSLKAKADREMTLQQESVDEAVRRARSGFVRRDFKQEDTLTLKQYELFRQIRLQHLFGGGGKEITGNIPRHRAVQEHVGAEKLLFIDGPHDSAQQ